MNEEHYIVFVRSCVIVFFLIRAPYKLRMQLSYVTKANLYEATGYALRDILGIALIVIGIIVIPLLWTPERFELGILSFSNGVRVFGMSICCLALLVFWLSHYYLGRNFNQIVALREGHELIQHGIYRYIRHPMHTSWYLLSLGFFLTTSNWIVGFMAVFGVQFLYLSRIGEEERLMIKEFGEDYENYIKRTGRLLPKLRAIF